MKFLLNITAWLLCVLLVLLPRVRWTSEPDSSSAWTRHELENAGSGGASAYYDNYKCFGTLQGDCIIKVRHLEGGFNDPNYRWTIECHDQEAVWGIFDFFDNFEGFTRVWCKNLFPLKQPSFTYPYYPFCNLRYFAKHEYYCFDQRDPLRTYDTFVTGFWDPSEFCRVAMGIEYKDCCS